jgi:hypothetical protein
VINRDIDERMIVSVDVLRNSALSCVLDSGGSRYDLVTRCCKYGGGLLRSLASWYGVNLLRKNLASVAR